jgi:hypothetical protein
MAAISFRHLRAGEKAVHVGGHSDRPERAVRVVLEAPDGHVLVTSIQLQRDGTFIGEVYGVMPNQHSVAVGDHVQFEESQIVRFRTADQRSDDEKTVDDMAEMASTFEERFRELSGEPEKMPEVSSETADLFAEAKAWNADEHAQAQPSETPAAAPAAPPPAAGRPAAPAPAPAALNPAVPAQTAPAPALPEPIAAVPKPARVEPPQAPAAAARVAAVETFKCMECGTKLVIPASHEGAPAEPPKVACPTCGRINRPPERRL